MQARCSASSTPCRSVADTRTSTTLSFAIVCEVRCREQATLQASVPLSKRRGPDSQACEYFSLALEGTTPVVILSPPLAPPRSLCVCVICSCCVDGCTPRPLALALWSFPWPKVRDLVTSTEAGETAAIATKALRVQLDKQAAALKQRDDEVSVRCGDAVGRTLGVRTEPL